MLVCKTTNGKTIIGLDADNITHLKDGDAIVLRLPEICDGKDIIILYGETTEDTKKRLEAVLGEPI